MSHRPFIEWGVAGRSAARALRSYDLLIVAWDGIRTDAQWQIAPADPPQSIADWILGECRKETDDALVLVLRYLGPGARR